MKLFLIFSMFVLSLTAPPLPVMLPVIMSEPLKPFEKIWQATCKVESNFDALAIGDKHLKNHSYGIAQIQESRLKDFQRRTGINYSLTDMYSPEKSKSVFMYYAIEIGPYNQQRISREWNGGIRGMQKKSTLKYWNKVRRHL